MTTDTKQARAGWREIRDEVRRRIHRRDWPPGELIPHETALAEEFGCARTTVNRALRSLAEDGLVDRRRKGGTRVALHPVRRAVLDIAIMRQEIEDTGATYGYRLVQSGIERPPANIPGGKGFDASCLHVVALHFANGAPYAVENRWIDGRLPGLDDAPFERISANEWLLENIPYTGGTLSFAAEQAAPDTARLLDIAAESPVLTLDRVTLDGDRVVTAVKLTYRAGHRFMARL
ncbi:GntR family transcriptional regulator [Chachezhania antarctica]|uniref:GntR family transcriptional regulator n=1 Tax=Chachezhania antarctica TaxID=2340860 RepID=UPI000EB0E6B7|nr:UTRA domain-containing protein [Chachezhania antarctica]